MKAHQAIIGFALFAMLCPTSFGQTATASAPGPLATINGTPITEDDVRTAAASDLETIEVKKLQTDAIYSRDTYDVYERTLANLITKNMVQAEASAKGVTPAVLLANEIEKRTKLPTNDEITAFWKRNGQSVPLEQTNVLPQIRTYLTRQAKEAAYHEFLQTLRDKYNVLTYLEPIRVSIPTSGLPFKGPADAPVTIIEFADFECPFCAGMSPTLQEILKDYGSKVRLVYAQFPLTNIHSNSQKAAEASLCANEQNKFWEMHDVLFQDNKALGVSALKEKAARIGLDTTAFDVCLDSAKYAKAVAADIREGEKVGITGTPTLFINGRFLNGAQPYEAISHVIDDEIQRADKYSRP